MVSDQIEAGKQLVDVLVSNGFDITAACWIKAIEENDWYFYISSKYVDGYGASLAYRELSRIAKSVSETWDLMSHVKLIGSEHPITRDVLELRKRYAGRFLSRAQRSMIGPLAIEEIYVNPLPQDEGRGPRQSFTITYYRQGETNRWTAETKGEELYQDLKAKGAVAYLTAHRGGEEPGSERFANISVLLEVDPHFDRENLFISPGVWQLMTNQARELADRMFKERHPDAVIEYDDEDE